MEGTECTGWRLIFDFFLPLSCSRRSRLRNSCNCGSHKCPADHHRFELTPTEKDALRSNYQSDFPAHPLSRVPKRNENAPRQETIFGNGKFDAQTTCQSDFRAPQGGAARAAKPPVGDPMLINNGNNQRSFTSENAASFSPKGYAMRESYAPTSSHTTKLPFEGQSTSATDYRAHNGAKPSTPFREQSTLSGAKEDRDFQSESALKFVGHSGVLPRESFQPNNRSRVNLPFEGQSTSSSDYRAHQLQGCPAKEIPDFDGHQANQEGHKLLTNAGGQWHPYQQGTGPRR